MPPKKQTITVYVVQEYNWEYNDEFYDRNDTGEALQTFRDRKKAEAYREQREREMQQQPNGFSPFQMNGLEFSDQTSLTFAQFQKGVRKLGLEVPSDELDCDEWWREYADEMTADQRFGVWQLMDQARFYELVETELEVEE